MRSTTTYVYNYVQQDLRACVYVCMCVYMYHPYAMCALYMPYMCVLYVNTCVPYM